MATPILTFKSICKRFPGVVALANVSFQVEAGECHAIVGENGAGKSTLGKIVAGIHRPDGGQVLLRGRPVSFRSPLDAARAGISIVHQELAFCPNLSVAENLHLGALPNACGWVRWRALATRTEQMLRKVGLKVASSTPIGALTTGQEQLVQIAMALDRGAELIIMDEPTSALSRIESERLFEILFELKQRGITILYVSHRMEEIQRVCDRITVLRDGTFVATRSASETSPNQLVRLMIGRSLEEYFPRHVERPAGATILSVDRLTSPGCFRDISFSVRAGEVVGMAGLVGAGRSEVARAIFGIDWYAGGTLRVGGKQVSIRSPRDAIRHGIGLVPEDRKRQGLVLSMTCRENLSLPLLQSLTRGPLIDRKREHGLAHEYFERLRLRAPNVDSVVNELSGGNQQKIALAKWLARHCPLLILDEPTRGIDVGTKAEIHALIDNLATEGHGILLISSELPEILHLSTRILVLANGRIVGELPRTQATQANVLRLMAQQQYEAC